MNELDLTFLLKGYKGIKFFSTLFGDTEIIEVYPNDCIDVCPYGCHDEVATIFINGNFGKDGQCVLYPSRALYEKYPLEAEKAWQEWTENRKSKRWTPQIGEHIFWVNANLTVSQDVFNDFETQRKRRAVNNEFKTGKEAQQAAEEVRKCLEAFHSRKEVKS